MHQLFNIVHHLVSIFSILHNIKVLRLVMKLILFDHMTPLAADQDLEIELTIHTTNAFEYNINLCA